MNYEERFPDFPNVAVLLDSFREMEDAERLETLRAVIVEVLGGDAGNENSRVDEIELDALLHGGAFLNQIFYPCNAPKS